MSQQCKWSILNTKPRNGATMASVSPSSCFPPQPLKEPAARIACYSILQQLFFFHKKSCFTLLTFRQVESNAGSFPHGHLFLLTAALGNDLCKHGWTSSRFHNVWCVWHYILGADNLCAQCALGYFQYLQSFYDNKECCFRPVSWWVGARVSLGSEVKQGCGHRAGLTFSLVENGHHFPQELVCDLDSDKQCVFSIGSCRCLVISGT